MTKTLKFPRPADCRKDCATGRSGKDISRFFKGEGRMVQPIQRVNADITACMLEELDAGPDS